MLRPARAKGESSRVGAAPALNPLEAASAAELLYSLRISGQLSYVALTRRSGSPEVPPESALFAVTRRPAAFSPLNTSATDAGSVR
jgi:hypothetical protein